MRLQIGRVDQDGLLLGAFRGQPLHHAGENPHVTPPLPSVVERLRRAILTWRVAPPQAIAIDEDYAAQNPPIIHPRLAMALREKRLQPLHLLVRQPEKIAHHHTRQFGALNHVAIAASSRSMGPDPNKTVWTSKRRWVGVGSKLLEPKNGMPLEAITNFFQ